MLITVNTVSTGVLSWICLVTVFVGVAIASSDVGRSPFYRFGPQKDLAIMGVAVDSDAKYAGVMTFCVVNSFVRSVETDVLQAWLINAVQDRSAPKTSSVRKMAYRIAALHGIYHWWDWFVYMNVLLAQFDFFLLEMGSSVVASLLTTRSFLRAPLHEGYEESDFAEDSGAED